MQQLNKKPSESELNCDFLRLIKNRHLLRSQKEEKQMEPEGKLDFPKRSLGDYFFRWMPSLECVRRWTRWTDFSRKTEIKC